VQRGRFSYPIHEHQPDVIFGTETWLTPNIDSTEFFPTGYLLFQKDSSDGYGGVFQTQLTSAISDFQLCCNDKKHIDVLFYQGPHTKLCHKLSHYGINGQILWIKNYLSDRSQSVVIDGRPISVTLGVPQGTVPVFILLWGNQKFRGVTG